MRTLIIIVLWFYTASPSLAHGGDEHATATWTFDPWIVTPVVIAVGLYSVGSLRLWLRSTGTHSEMLWQVGLYGLGLLTLGGALISPLHWLGEHLFTFHMIEHEVVIAVSAPLIVLSRPVSAFMWAMPRIARHRVGTVMNFIAVRKTWDWLTRGINATLLHGAAIWAWHVPLLFDASVINLTVHRLQHLSFFATALLFWWSVLWRCDRGVAALHLFLTMIHTSLLGALMALAPRVLYVVQTADAIEWGLTPLEDQQLAGMLMWIPAGTVYAAAALMMLLFWIKRSSAGEIHNV